MNIITSGKEYESWNESAQVQDFLYRLRDEIIHGDTIFFTIDQARNVRDGYYNFINRLHQESIKSRKE